mmetsp:Transcript_6932/g.14845  ORF Transcript_6932/g.14845 Transcript_6932/m.14845 type:complete len:359 (-) Transcript_6932:415-1491(-)
MLVAPCEWAAAYPKSMSLKAESRAPASTFPVSPKVMLSTKVATLSSSKSPFATRCRQLKAQKTWSRVTFPCTPINRNRAASALRCSQIRKVRASIMLSEAMLAAPVSRRPNRRRNSRKFMLPSPVKSAARRIASKSSARQSNCISAIRCMILCSNSPMDMYPSLSRSALTKKSMRACATADGDRGTRPSASVTISRARRSTSWSRWGGSWSSERMPEPMFQAEKQAAMSTVPLSPLYVCTLRCTAATSEADKPAPCNIPAKRSRIIGWVDPVFEQKLPISWCNEASAFMIFLKRSLTIRSFTSFLMGSATDTWNRPSSRMYSTFPSITSATNWVTSSQSKSEIPVDVVQIGIQVSMGR